MTPAEEEQAEAETSELVMREVCSVSEDIREGRRRNLVRNIAGRMERLSECTNGLCVREGAANKAEQNTQNRRIGSASSGN